MKIKLLLTLQILVSVIAYQQVGTYYMPVIARHLAYIGDTHDERANVCYMDNQYEDEEGKCFCEQHPGQFSCAFIPHAGGGSDWVDYSTPTGGNDYGRDPYGTQYTNTDIDIDIFVNQPPQGGKKGGARPDFPCTDDLVQVCFDDLDFETDYGYCRCNPAGS